MPVFQYKALKGDGAVAEGEIEAGGRQEAFRQMEGLGLRPIRLAERNGNGSPKKCSEETTAQTFFN
jgi:type II secretory pathway component PulF